VLPVSLFPPVPHLRLILEDGDLPASSSGRDLSADTRPGNYRRADLYVAFPRDHQDIVYADDFSGVDGQRLNSDLISGLNAVLLAARLDNRIRIQQFTYSTHKDRGRLIPNAARRTSIAQAAFMVRQLLSLSAKQNAPGYSWVMPATKI
jgi:hypothetical protein